MEVAFISLRAVMIKLIFFSSMSITSMITMFSHPWDGITRRQVFHKSLRKMLVIFVICMVVYNLKVEAFQCKCLHKIP